MSCSNWQITAQPNWKKKVTCGTFRRSPTPKNSARRSTEDLLQAIHEDELFAPVDIQRQEQLVEQIASALPEDKRALIVELADNHARHVWLQQEGAYHLGLAVGRKLRKLG